MSNEYQDRWIRCTQDAIEVRGAITAAGTGSDAVRTASEIAGLDNVLVTSQRGQAVVRASSVAEPRS